MGDEIFKEIVCMLGERKLINDEDLIIFEKIDSEREYEEVCFEFFVDIFIIVISLVNVNIRMISLLIMQGCI